MIDHKTTHLQLPKPHAGNSLSDDVARLANAFDLIDTAIQALYDNNTAPLATLITEMATVKPIVQRLNTLSQFAEMTPESTQITRNAAGQITRLTEIIAGQSKITDFTRSGNRISAYTVTYLGVTTTYTLSRDATGITGITT